MNLDTTFTMQKKNEVNMNQKPKWHVQNKNNQKIVYKNV